MKRWAISFLIAALAALVLYIPVNNLHIQYNDQLYQESRNQASEHLNFIRDDIQSKLDSSLYNADFFEMIVSQNPEITETELREYCSFIIERNPLVDSISLAKDGVIHFIHPLEGNEEAMGFDMMEEQDQQQFLEEAIQKKEAVAQGPVVAVQGGTKIFNRKPVFIESISTEEVWGFANVTIDFDRLVENSLMGNQPSTYRYAIKVDSGGTSPGIWGVEDVFESEAVTASISLPKNDWTIALVPRGGWERDQRYHRMETLIFYVFILIIFKLVIFFVYQYFTKRELSRTDALTHLLNKKTFEQSVKKILKFSLKKNGLLLLDFNDFKLINDTYGHLAGDNVLSITAERLSKCMKKGDLIGRIGGDEIMILVRDIESEEKLESIKNRIIQHIEQPIHLNDHMISPSISVGHTLISQWLPFDFLYESVDRKMYRHKSIKKSVYSQPINQSDLKS